MGDSKSVRLLRQLVAEQYNIPVEQVRVAHVPIAYPDSAYQNNDPKDMAGAVRRLIEGWDAAHDDQELIDNCEPWIQQLKAMLS